MRSLEGSVQNINTKPEVKINWFPKKLTRGVSSKLKITLEIPEGIHIQAHKPTEELLIPTKIALKETADISFGDPIYPEPEKLPTLWSEVELLVYEESIDILVPFEVSKNAKSGKSEVEANLAFQGCTATLCLPPRQQKFFVSFIIL
jgi:thioredoxin:protein disulfide reductase